MVQRKLAATDVKAFRRASARVLRVMERQDASKQGPLYGRPKPLLVQSANSPTFSEPTPRPEVRGGAGDSHTDWLPTPIQNASGALSNE